MSLMIGKKAGYTLVEVLVVVVIIGILSSLGVVGLQQAIANARIKDAAFNTTAFLETMSNESSRLSSTLCIESISDQSFYVYSSEDDCNTMVASVDTFRLDPPTRFLNSCSGLSGTNLLKENGKITPKLGLSALPREGYICMQYGTKDVFGAAHKLSNVNSVKPKWKAGSDSDPWSGL